MAEKTIDIALESSVQEIKSAIEEMGSIVALESTSQEILIAANAAKTAAESANSAVSSGLSAVKSVQTVSVNSTSLSSGTADSVTGSLYYKDYTINSVDTSKTVLIINANCTTNTTEYMTPLARLVSSTKVRIYPTHFSSSSGNGTINDVIVQVVEYT